MSGEGATLAAMPSHFDQRPRVLEATRGADPLLQPMFVVQDGLDGLRIDAMVWAERDANGWKIRLTADGAFTAENALKVASEISHLCELIEGRAEF